MKALDLFKKHYKGTNTSAKNPPMGRSAKKDISNGICGHCEGDCGSGDSR